MTKTGPKLSLSLAGGDRAEIVAVFDNGKRCVEVVSERRVRLRESDVAAIATWYRCAAEPWFRARMLEHREPGLAAYLEECEGAGSEPQIDVLDVETGVTEDK